MSYPHPAEPYRQTGVKLGDEQFALAPEWEGSGRLALVGMGVEPGLSDVGGIHARRRVRSRARRRSALDVGEDLLEHLGGVRHRLGLEAELLHDL